MLGSDGMIIYTISVDLNFDMCNMMDENYASVTVEYHENCCEKKVLNKFNERV